LKQHKVVVGRRRRRWLATKKFPGWQQLFDPGKERPALQRQTPSAEAGRSFHARIVTSRLRVGFDFLGDSNFCLELVVVDPPCPNITTSICQRSVHFPAMVWTTAMIPNVPDQHKHHPRRTTMSSAKGAKSLSASLP
jgi:hypothetical protein